MNNDKMTCTQSAPILLHEIELNDCDATKKNLLSGRTIDGFEIEGFIRETSLTDIYHAVEQSTDRPVIIKTIKTECSSKKRSIDRFLNEVKTLNSLDHPLIPRVIKSGQQGPLYYSVLEPINGQLLEDSMTQQAYYQENECLKYMISIAEALMYAWNEHRIIHCNIKPRSVLLGKQQATLVNWSLAQQTTEQLNNKGFNGTPAYMSPEQTSGKPLNFHTDMFSLGMLCFELLSGQQAFSGNTPNMLFLAINKKYLSYKPLKEQKVSDATCRLIQRMTAKKQDHRFSSWEEFIAEADACLNPTKQVRSARPYSDSL
jgi:eukaryotic-like serine/threonine-protein kinase